jgi:histidyl-tRNA synthetase
MNYADKIGVPFVVFLGEDEIREGVVACKDMKSGEQTKLGFEETLARVRDGLARMDEGAVILG